MIMLSSNAPIVAKLCSIVPGPLCCSKSLHGTCDVLLYPAHYAVVNHCMVQIMIIVCRVKISLKVVLSNWII